MIRGTRIIENAYTWRNRINAMSDVANKFGYQEIILPSLWEQQTFVKKAGAEIISQMWSFKDKGGRDVCLIPEATAIVQEFYQPKLLSLKLPHRIFYVQKCYRYERPQAGRYREFTQFGLECLGPTNLQDDMIPILREMLGVFSFDFEIKTQVKRGLDYYIDDGFEATCDILGAQKQVAGGGRYENGIGFAIGVDRAILAEEKTPAMRPGQVKGIVPRISGKG